MLYLFHSFELDEQLYQLRRDGKLVDIEPKVFDVLTYLLHNRDRVVSKDELLDKLWPGQVVSETALTRCIVAARKAVGDGGGKQQLIKTQHGRGYRFVAAVTEQAGKLVTEAGSNSTTPVPFSPPSLELAGEGQGEDQIPLPTLLSALRSDSPPVLISTKPSLVVLPFVNMSQDPGQEYFSDGITEDITTDLSKISSLFVISRNSAFTYKGKASKVQDISREMGVRYVLEGSVRRASDRVRVSAQLIDALTDHHLWAERYDRPLTDIFAVQDEIVQQLVITLRVEVQAAEYERVRRIPTANLNAYDALLRGMDYFLRGVTKETQAQARQMFERAIELDPQYAAAYCVLGLIYFIEWIAQWNQNSHVLEQAFILIQKAIALDTSLSRAHALLGNIYLWKKQYEQAIAQGELAVALNTNSEDGYVALGDILNFSGRPMEALEAMEKALRLNPRYPPFYLRIVGTAYYLLGRYEEAIESYKKVLTRNPNWLLTHVNLAHLYSELGREREAKAEVTEILRLSPNYSLEGAKQTWPYKDPAVLERVLAALRKAGLK